MAMLPNELKKFIKAHINDDTVDLLLRQKKYPQYDIKFVVQQIEGYRKAQNKFKKIAKNEDFIYPPKINLEQCSSETTAKYKAETFAKSKTIIDITGGLGIDTIYLSKQSPHIIYVEQNPELFKIAQENFKTLKLENVDCVNDDGISFLQNYASKVDMVYADPARRDQHNRKMVSLADCTPNLLQNIDTIFTKTNQLLIKASPMLDISLAKQELPYVSNITIVAVKNECKEILFLCENNTKKHSIPINCINFINDEDYEIFASTKEIEEQQQSIFADAIEKYLYEPNVAIAKAGFFNTVSTKYKLPKLHHNTHLYTSNNFLYNFPGRIFEVEKEISLTARNLKPELPEAKAHVITKNYPLSAEQLQKKLHITEGGNKFIVATTQKDGKKIGLLCKKVK